MVDGSTGQTKQQSSWIATLNTLRHNEALLINVRSENSCDQPPSIKLCICCWFRPRELGRVY